MQAQSLYSRQIEFKCLKTLTSEKIPEKIRVSLFSKLDNDWFHDPSAKAVYNRIESLLKNRTELPVYEDLCNDPVLEEDAREDIQDIEVSSCKSKKEIKRMLSTLRKYRKIRHVYQIAKNLKKDFDSDSFDVDITLNSISNAILKLNTESKSEEIVYNHDGTDKLALEKVEECLQDEKSDLIKTGFKVYDDKAGGLPSQGVMILAATTSGGKSTISMNLGLNICDLSHKRVVRMSLEMSDSQEINRMLSCITEIPFSKFRNKQLTKEDKNTIRKKYAEVTKKRKENKACYSHWSPKASVTFQEAMALIRPSKFDVIFVDYVSLFEGVDVDQQWRVLVQISRQAKIFSRENNCLVVLLCQLDDETDKLRYSRGVKENADVMWRWNYSKDEQRELKIIPIKQDKCRDGELFNFELADRFDIMKVTDIEEGNGYNSNDYSTDEDDEDNNVVGFRSGGSYMVS